MLEFVWNNGILRLLYTSVGIHWVGCAVAVFFKTEKFYDLTGIGAGPRSYNTWVKMFLLDKQID